jgi:tetratricopeptide (TPR) repeat protein
MVKLTSIVVVVWLFAFAGCGPDTIFVRPGLDTPAQHVSNGHQLLERGKVNDAFREFDRARELDPDFVRAYIGLGLVLGHKGEFEAGIQAMEQAGQMASSDSDREAVKKGHAQLKAMQPAP